MPSFVVIDAEGKWVVNPHSFPFVDPETLVRYEPGQPHKVVCGKGSWLEAQMAAGVLKPAPDPLKAPPKGAASTAPAPSGPA